MLKKWKTIKYNLATEEYNNEILIVDKWKDSNRYLYK